MSVDIAANIERTRQEIAKAMHECKRDADPNDNAPLLIAVSKTVGIEEVSQAIECGIHDFGENRAQELVCKHAAYPDENWHFIGRIQTNKIKDIVGVACLIHSVASTRVLEKINDRASSLDIVQDILLEVNVSGEESKDGFKPKELEAVLADCENLSSIKVRGLMTMAPAGDKLRAREVFANLRAISNELKVKCKKLPNVDLCELSMGMTQDFQEAIYEGCTIVRLGHSIFA